MTEVRCRDHANSLEHGLDELCILGFGTEVDILGFGVVVNTVRFDVCVKHCFYKACVRIDFVVIKVSQIKSFVMVFDVKSSMLNPASPPRFLCRMN